MKLEDLYLMLDRVEHKLDSVVAYGYGPGYGWVVDNLLYNEKVLRELIERKLTEFEGYDMLLDKESVAIRCLPKKQANFVCCKGSMCKGNSRSRFPKHNAKRVTLRTHRIGR